MGGDSVCSMWWALIRVDDVVARTAHSDWVPYVEGMQKKEREKNNTMSERFKVAWTL